MCTSRLLRVLCMVIGTVCPMLSAAEPGEAAAANVAFDFANTLQPISHLASGVLLALSATEPPDSMVLPLHLTTFRAWDIKHHPFTPELFKRVQSIGVTHLQLIIYNSWSDQRPKQWPGDHGDWAPFERFLEDFMKKRSVCYPGCELDIWNEPDGRQFWGRDFGQYLEAWRHAVVKIRALDPLAVIVGPSLSVGMEKGFPDMERFLLFAQQNGVLPDVLSWHELRAPDGRAIPEHVAKTRKFLTEHGIAIKRISINEIVAEYAQHRPGATVSYFSALETCGVESAAKTCWGNDSTGKATSWNGKPADLDGLLTIDTHAPRSTWWVYKAYAEMPGCYCPMIRDPHRRIDGFAGNDAAEGRAAILIGSCDETANLPLHLTLRNLDHIGTAADARGFIATVHLIPFSGHDALASPILDSTTAIPAGARSADIDIPQLVAMGACTVVLERK